MGDPACETASIGSDRESDPVYAIPVQLLIRSAECVTDQPSVYTVPSYP